MTALVDNRVKMSLAGMVVGGAAPIGLLIFGTLLHRRYRAGEEVAEDLAERVPFVAVLPEVDGPGALGMMAARCVHDIRARLQPRGTEQPRVYLVASTSPGEGKNAITLGLAFSFAAAGFRTLIVDGDLTTRRLTVDFDAGESPGLVEAIGGSEPFVQRIRGGPFLLGTGRSTTRDACRLVPGDVRRILATLRERFEVVLIVGDPILTGITATVIAPQADGLILAIAHGQKPGLVHQAVRQVEMLGTGLVAAVFNRADPSELPIDVKAREAAAVAQHRAFPEKVRRLGPLVTSVLASISHTRAEDVELVSELDVAGTDSTTSQGDPTDEAHDRRARGRDAA